MVTSKKKRKAQIDSSEGQKIPSSQEEEVIQQRANRIGRPRLFATMREPGQKTLQEMSNTRNAEIAESVTALVEEVTKQTPEDRENSDTTMQESQPETS